jgi:hypothetical protein
MVFSCFNTFVLSWYKNQKGGIMSEDVVYVSRVRIERIKGPLRRAYLPQEDEPVLFGVHSEIAEHYGVDPQVHQPHAATLDYVVAAAAG